ncbi:MAG: DUF1501 domain-containing protein [Planctomycetaceae bacterium]
MIELAIERITAARLLSRRGLLRATFGSGAGLGLLGLLSRSASAEATNPSEKAVIQIWLGGGPSHLDLYDLKPDAPAAYRGPFRFISTDQPGAEVCELLPRHARIMRSLSLIRSLTHTTSDHVAGTHWMQTGYFGATAASPDPTHPSAGSIVAESRASRGANALPYVHVLPELPIETYSRQFNAAYLGKSFNPFEVRMPFPGYNAGAQFAAHDLQAQPQLDLGRLDRRLNLRQRLDRPGRQFDGNVLGARDYERAFDVLAATPIRQAFDLSRERPEVRARYGMTVWGQAALLCRRLVEAGATFVTLNTDSSSNMWDNHAGVEKYFRIMLPAYDAMLSALIEDLIERGLYERVIVLVWGEFGRTPRMNAKGGRDHWGKAGCALIGGGGLRVGQVIGATTAKGEEPARRPIGPGDVLATLYRQLGVDTTRQFINHAGRPVPILTDGKPIEELLA